MFYPLCSLKNQINVRYCLTARRHDRQLVDKSNRLFSNLQCVCCIKTVIDLRISCVLATFNKDDDDDDDAAAESVILPPDQRNAICYISIKTLTK